VEVLLDNGAAVDEMDVSGQTALHLATAHGWKETLAHLLSNGANAGQGGGEGLTALHVASREGDLEAVRLFLKARVDIEQEDDLGRRALTWAISSKSKPVVNLILTSGASAKCSFHSQVSICRIASPIITAKLPLL
jgi:ankyrin repeat protein